MVHKSPRGSVGDEIFQRYFKETRATGVSIVIPTRNRDEDLTKLLASIGEQTKLPIEIIVVDDSDNLRTKNLVERLRKNFSDKGVSLKYLRGNEDNRSISAARNLGAKVSTGEIVFFIDDDVILDRDYIQQITKVYHDYPDAVGVGGNLFPRDMSVAVLVNALHRVLFSACFQKDRSVVWAQGMTFAFPLTKTIRSQWLSGTNATYKKQILEDFKWDEKLVRFSLCEDMDISYRILRKYPNSLYITPHAKAHHKYSPVARIEPKSLTHIRVAYSTYFFFKNFELTLPNMVVYVWSMFFGRFFWAILMRDRRSILFLMSAYMNLFKNFSEIKNGNFSSFQIV